MRKHLLLGVAAAAMLLVTAAAADDAASYRAGLELYERGHYAAALDALARSADAGNVRAQEMAGFMLLAGPALYGSAVPRDRAGGRAWLLRAARSGSAPARAMVCGRGSEASAACAGLPALSAEASAR